MKFSRLALFLLLLCAASYAQEKVKVIINVHTSNVEDTSQVFIAGNQIEFGAWQPGDVALEKAKDSLWTSEFTFEKGTMLQFKFTQGSWANEALNSEGHVPPNHSFIVNNDTTADYRIINWRDESAGQVTYDGQITGEVRYHESMSYPGILDRDVILWLPPGYNESPGKRYQVLYMNDGQSIIDPATSGVTHVDWQVDEALDSLIRKGEVEPTIVVGIYNTPHRTPEYSPTDTGYTYMKFVVEELKPFIDKTYRTKPGREHTAVAGSSMGGIISFMFLWHYNDVFSKAVCMSPAFKVVLPARSINVDYVDDVLEYTGERKDIKVYIDNGGQGIEQIIQPGVDDMLAALKKQGYREGIDYIFVLDEKAEHTESAWAQRLPNALKFIFERN